MFSHKVMESFKRAKKVVVITGAGISAESGVPTFRGANGLWRRYRAEDLATLHAFQKNPQLVWEWYDWKRGGWTNRSSANPGRYYLSSSKA